MTGLPAGEAIRSHFFRFKFNFVIWGNEAKMAGKFGFPGADVTHPMHGGKIGIFLKKYPHMWRAAGEFPTYPNFFLFDY
jgi:hypothetical protein